jgi:hypothetical protein
MSIDPVRFPPLLPIVILDGDPVRAHAVAAVVRDLGGAPVDADQAERAAAVLRHQGCDAPVTDGIPTLGYGAPSAPRWSTALPAPNNPGFAAALAPWLDTGGALRRVAALFGDEATLPMAIRLAEDLRRFTDSPGIERDEAHRLGGFAGTLGFRRLAHCAERVSQGDDMFLAAARREADTALGILAAYRASPA